MKLLIAIRGIKKLTEISYPTLAELSIFILARKDLVMGPKCWFKVVCLGIAFWSNLGLTANLSSLAITAGLDSKNESIQVGPIVDSSSAGGSNISPLSGLISQFLRNELVTEEVRLDLVNKSCLYAEKLIKFHQSLPSYAKDGPTQTKSAYYTKQRCSEDQLVHKKKIENLQTLLRQDLGGEGDQFLSYWPDLKNIEGSYIKCKKLLRHFKGRSRFSDENVDFEEEEEGVQTSNLKSVNDASKFFYRAINLLSRNQNCQKQLSTVQFNGDLAGESLGKCFGSIIIEEASKLRVPISIEDNSPFLSPMNKNMPDFDLRHKRVTEFVESSADYQLFPWDLFRICAIVAGGNLESALNICYQSLRFNRLRPDFKRKLVDIRGDRPTGGDNSGDWYHIFGMAYTALVLGKSTYVLYWLNPGIIASLVQDKDSKEQHFDFVGSVIGITIRELLESSNSKDLGDSMALCKPDLLLQVID